MSSKLSPKPSPISLSLNPLTEPLTFQIVDFYTDNFLEKSADDEDDNEEDDVSVDSDYKVLKDEREYKIIIFGKDYLERTYSLLVNGFTPYFYVKLPDSTKPSQMEAFESWIKSKMWDKYKDCLLRVTLEERKIFRGFDDYKDSLFARLVFSNYDAARKAMDLFQTKKFSSESKRTTVYPKLQSIPCLNKGKSFNYDLYDNMIDPLLKFIHHRAIKPVGWITVAPGLYNTREDIKTTCDIDLETKWTNIKVLTREDSCKMRILCFDIEADSSHGDFPLPIKDYLKVARELYGIYEILQKNTKTKLTKEEIKPRILSSLIMGFGAGSMDGTISKIYTKENKRPTETERNDVSMEIAKILSTSDKVLKGREKTDEKTAKINEIRDILNAKMPKLEGDKTIQIGCCFLKYGENMPYKKVIFTLNTCSSFDDDSIVIECRNEVQLLLGFRDLIKKDDVDCIIGYNSEGFDFPWIYKRADELGISEEFGNISRIEGLHTKLAKKQSKGLNGELIEIEFANIPGRIQMDVLKQVKKNYNLESYKLDDVAANFIQGPIQKVERIEDKTRIYTKNLTGLNIGNYVIFSERQGYLELKYRDGEKFKIINKNSGGKDKIYFEIEHELELDYEGKNCVWCLGKDDVSPQDIFRLQKGSSEDRAIIAKYCIMDVVLTIELFMKLEFLTNAIGMANVCLNPISWIIHRGQGVKILSLIADFLKKKKYVLPFLYKELFDKESYEGAVVLKPYPGIYLDEPISALDYGSLYPSSMIERNISHETKVILDEHLGDEGGKRLEEMGYNYVDITYDTYGFSMVGKKQKKVPIGKKTVRYIQALRKDGSIVRGILPEILEYLLGNRKATRERAKWKTVEKTDGTKITGGFTKTETEIIIKDEKKTVYKIPLEEVKNISNTYNEFQQKVLDGLQLAFKVVANSLYGQMGAKTSDVYDKEIAASTTATGRERLMFAQEYVQNPLNFPQVLKDGRTIYLENKIVYGDTDSVFIKFDLRDDEGNKLTGKPALYKSIEIAMDTDKKIQKILPYPQKLEYDKTMWPFILFTKKRYVGHLYEEDPEDYELKSMGIVLKRRDNAPIVKILYGGVIDIILNERDITKSIIFLQKSLNKLKDGKYPLESLIITKMLNSYYKDPDKIAHKVLADRIGERDPGNKPQVNDRVPFVYIQVKEDGKKKALQGDKIENPDYIKKNGLKPDYKFYITNQIMKPVSQIYGLCLEDIPTYRGSPEIWEKMREKLIEKGKNEMETMKIINTKRGEIAGKIVFADILRTLENSYSGQREMSSFFASKKTVSTVKIDIDDLSDLSDIDDEDDGDDDE